MFSATHQLLGSSALQVSPWVSVTACEFLSLPARGSPVHIGQMYRKGVQGGQRGFFSWPVSSCFLCSCCTFLTHEFWSLWIFIASQLLFVLQIRCGTEEFAVAVKFAPGHHYLQLLLLLCLWFHCHSPQSSFNMLLFSHTRAFVETCGYP